VVICLILFIRGVKASHECLMSGSDDVNIFHVAVVQLSSRGQGGYLLTRAHTVYVGLSYPRLDVICRVLDSLSLEELIADRS
jgi:hypothetical protein